MMVNDSIMTCEKKNYWLRISWEKLTFDFLLKPEMFWPEMVLHKKSDKLHLPNIVREGAAGFCILIH